MSRKRNHAMKFDTPTAQPKNLPTPFIKTAVDAEPEPLTKKQKLGTFLSQGFVRTLGIMLLALSATVYVQLVPLTLVFVGGILNIQPDASLNNIDSMIWILTGLAVIVPMVWVFLKWVKYVWGRFIVQPISFFPSRTTK